MCPLLSTDFLLEYFESIYSYDLAIYHKVPWREENMGGKAILIRENGRTYTEWCQGSPRKAIYTIVHWLGFFRCVAFQRIWGPVLLYKEPDNIPSGRLFIVSTHLDPVPKRLQAYVAYCMKKTKLSLNSEVVRSQSIVCCLTFCREDPDFCRFL